MIGLMGTKVGMTQVFDEYGMLTPVSVLEVDPNVVIGHRTEERDGYSALILGYKEQKPSRLTKPVLGQFKDGVSPTRHIFEMRDFDGEHEIGKSFGVDLFEGTSFLDITGTSKGKGFQGVIKRHGFGGGRATHGSKFHRENGSTGQAAWPSKVMKGTRMAGRMGGETVTVQNLRIVKIDADKNCILVEVAVPGPNGSSVILRRAKKKR